MPNFFRARRALLSPFARLRFPLARGSPHPRTRRLPSRPGFPNSPKMGHFSPSEQRSASPWHSPLRSSITIPFHHDCPCHNTLLIVTRRANLRSAGVFPPNKPYLSPVATKSAASAKHCSVTGQVAQTRFPWSYEVSPFGFSGKNHSIGRPRHAAWSRQCLRILTPERAQCRPYEPRFRFSDGRTPTLTLVKRDF